MDWQNDPVLWEIGGLNEEESKGGGGRKAEEEQTKNQRRSTECLALSTRYEYRRAFSEVALLQSLEYTELKEGYSYNFITAGDVDALSFLKIILNRHTLDHLLFSTWCMAAEDVFFLSERVKDGKIRHMDAYLGEIFPNSYIVEFAMLKKMYKTYPDLGRYAIFRNHSKIFAGCNLSEGFYFGIQSSANINTNPRTENACITINREIYDFYRNYFDGIKSFEKDANK